ncbi:MAG: F-box protein [Chlamydiales bacterium]|nr:F-box protein [Chlamydiales bacterium]
MSTFPISGRNCVENQSPWVESPSDEVMVKIFSYLSPEDLAACSQTCSNWRRISQDPRFYQTFAARFHYFHRKEGAEYFQGMESRERFLAIYKSVRGYDVEEIERLLPPSSEFENGLDVQYVKSFHSFNYWENRRALQAYLDLGGAQKENSCSRLILLASYFGDTEMFERISIDRYSLFAGAVYAVLGNQLEVLKKVKKLGVDLSEKILFTITWVDYLMGLAKSEEMRALLQS